ncbi:LEAF RUST 10 DISEASE-RESISTANCE LOCUS RECEPTOR-LIKE PROTEIN KINASE-like 1.5 [Gastrolobium bilobum]|uniref:LEAF RUST 10 DISEASE-RESISTANCE LOCUS RECEPTOR-LIKE PROTEIN KINASE-like 1.5 n=1 Tax=Gastrolobium bilobum TaxID=150636 RepID=UPI002AB002EC|nr:LEAF RUST 10 DISEASE-RESISTANCE LOCUS RECEPTOR-LIKE PROTEIN KINASE-like 1.5 [Gastrolobium bilobum]
MSPPPPNSSTLAILPFTFFFSVLVLFSTSTYAHTCSSNPNTSTYTCPPFPPNPPFPFSSSPGCGHPSFQLKCSTPHSVISINNLSFSILSYNPNSSSIVLSPHNPINTQPHKNHCPSSHFLSIPNRSINLSGSPFRVSDAPCSRLSFLQPCSPPTLPNCSHCPWECNLIKNPGEVLRDCRSMHHSASDSEPTCQSDVLSHLDEILSLGIEVDWDETQDPYFSSCNSCHLNKGFCGFNSSDPDKQFICFHSESTFSPPWINKLKKHNRIAVFAVVIALTSLLLLVSVTTAILRSRRFKPPSTEEDPTTIFLHNHRSASLLPPVFTYEELESSTNHFDLKRKIGDGGFGSVFLGHLHDGRLVAVKYLHRHHATSAKKFSTKSFCNEILILSSIGHPNLVKLHGYCSDPRGLLLVYDYVPNGTLADHLHGKKVKGSLTWQERLEIALQTALAMEYLHFSMVPPIVHRDITSSNIFVERDMSIKVGDFGLSRLLVLQDNANTNSNTSNGGYVWTGPQGTPGYLDPDYYRSFRLTEKSDVYSFGVVLLELISGLRAVDQRRDKREMALADMVVSRIQMGQLQQVLDPFLALEGEAVDAVASVAELAFRCVAADKDDRPDSKEVVLELKRVRSRVLLSANGDVAKE